MHVPCFIHGRANPLGDRKSTRLNSSHLVISYAVFCMKKINAVYHHPPKEFHFDLAIDAALFNTGHSLSMQPALVKRYVAAAIVVAAHGLLTPDALALA